MIKVLPALLLVVVAGPAWAGCANYTDGSLTAHAPRVEICFRGLCEQTTMDFECGNASGAHIGYANGWHAEYAGKIAYVYQRLDGKDVVLPASRFQDLKCHNIDDYACRFPSNGY